MIAVLFGVGCTHATAADRPPNVVILLADDLGYGDVGVFGSKTIRTPNLDRMAGEGMRLTNFYVAQAVCTASRAALLTACYPNRVGMQGALNHTSTTGLNPDEFTMAEMFKAKGYATAAYGKWHLGTKPQFNPIHNGFDEFLGLPYSNDNGKYHPVIKDIPDLPLLEGEKVIALEPDQSQFTKMFTDRAVGFIQKNKDRPFFLYVPHVMPHVPIFASDRFKGRSGKGLYTDVVEELDWGIGEVFKALKDNGVDDNTLVVFFSDNGPFLSYGDHAGSAGPLREGKLTAYDGGMRSPGIVRWPKQVPAGTVCDEPITAMDLMPTFARLVGASMPTDRVIDGKDIWPLLSGAEGATSPHEAIYFYSGEELHAVLSGDWKLHVPHPYLAVAGEPGTNGKPSNYGKLQPASIEMSGVAGIASRHGYKVVQQPLALYNLKDDIGEHNDVSAAHPDVVARLQALIEKARADLGDSLTNRKGANVRPAGNIP